MINLFKEGVFIDMWTVAHFLFGVLAFLFFVEKEKTKKYALLITLFIAIFWEFFEIKVKVYEFVTNRFVDVLITVAAFYLMSYADKKTKFMNIQKDRETLWYYSILFYIFIVALGWMSYVFL